MKLADYDDVDVDLTANAFECFEDEEVFELGDGEEFDQDDTRCPYDDGHAVSPLLSTTQIPAGVPEAVAQDFWHFGRKAYQFRLDPDS